MDISSIIEVGYFYRIFLNTSKPHSVAGVEKVAGDKRVDHIDDKHLLLQSLNVNNANLAINIVGVVYKVLFEKN